MQGLQEGLQEGSGPSYNARLSSEGLLAQLVEQRTLNPLVVGSNPTGPTKIRAQFAFGKKHLRIPRCFFYGREGAFVASHVPHVPLGLAFHVGWLRPGAGRLGSEI